MLILLTGGSACGKSSYGEKLAVLGPKPLYYIAAMQPYDDECLKKIARHRELRKDKGFLTIEQYTGVDTSMRCIYGPMIPQIRWKRWWPG